MNEEVKNETQQESAAQKREKAQTETIGKTSAKSVNAQQEDELEIAKREAAENLAGWQRSKADFLNYKKQQESFVSEVRKAAAEDCWLELLPVVDNFALATKHLPCDLQNSEWVRGVLHIQTMLEKLLADNGVEPIMALGKKFDPEIAEAVAETWGEEPAGEVTEEVQRGYLLRGKVLRAAKVKVAKGKKEDADEAKEKGK